MLKKWDNPIPVFVALYIDGNKLDMRQKILVRVAFFKKAASS